MFYFTLGNLPPKHRSRLSAIHLVAIVKTTILSTYGMDAVLRPFVEDMKKLVCTYAYICTHVYTLYVHVSVKLYTFRKRALSSPLKGDPKFTMVHFVSYQPIILVVSSLAVSRRAVLLTGCVGTAWPLKCLPNLRYV